MFSYERFKKICEEHGFSPSGLCVAIGKSKSLASKWKVENGSPSTDVLCEMAEKLGVSTDYILGLTEIEKPATNSDGSDGLSDKQKEFIRLLSRMTDQEVDSLISHALSLILGQ